MLEPLVQLDEREDLAGDVTVLAPAADLVVVELRVHVPVRGAFAFSLIEHFHRIAATAPNPPAP